MTRRAIQTTLTCSRSWAATGMHLGVNTVAAAQLSGGSRTTLGLIPAGTGNDLCRGIGLDAHDAVAAAAVIAAGHSRSLDLAQVGDTYVGGCLPRASTPW